MGDDVSIFLCGSEIKNMFAEQRKTHIGKVLNNIYIFMNVLFNAEN